MKLIKRAITACITIAMCMTQTHCTQKDKPASPAQKHVVENDSDIYVGIYLIPDSIAF